MSELIELLKIEYDDIRARFKKASIERKGTPQEIADRRENVMNDFFRRYFPFPYKVNIETLLGHIYTYYEEKQLSREYQVDIIFAGDYVILNGVENYIEIDDCKEFCVFKAESEGLGVLLFLMNCFPLSEDSMFSSVTMPYLENVLKDYDRIECEEINKRIRELNKM